MKRRVALVGKGLTFDSGGYNLKVGAAQIDMMKFDMGWQRRRAGRHAQHR